MDLSSIEGYEEALRVFRANVSPRYNALTNLDNWANGRQYQGLPNWFSVDKPLWERAPCIVYLLTKESIESKVDLVLGEGRFPAVTTSPGEGDPLADPDDGAGDQAALSKPDSQLMDAFIDRVLKQSSYRSASREVLHHAQEVSSSLIIFGVRNRKLFCDTTKAQWCEPTLDADGRVLRIEIKYPYIDPYQDEQRKWRVRVKIFRRVIDDKTDTTFLPGDASPYGAEPKWRPDPNQVFEHGFGFCPVIWYPFMRGCSTANQIDGNAPHELILDEIRALDFALSQRHRAALSAGDPQWTECGVPPGFNPTAPARTPVMPGTAAGGPVTPSNPATTSWAEPQTAQPARMKSPGVVWQYPDKETKVELHCLPPEALKAVSDHAADLRMKLCEMLAHVPLDPDAISHIRQLSGKALESLRKRELNRCDRIRDDFGDACLVPSVQMLLRICAVFADRPKELNLAGLRKVAPILRRYVANDMSIRLAWGDYDDPDPDEQQKVVASTCQAYQAGLVTDRMAMARLQSVFDIDNVDEAVKALQDEKAERQQRALEIATAQSSAEQENLHRLAQDADQKSTRGGRKSQPTATQGGGSNGARAPDAGQE